MGRVKQIRLRIINSSLANEFAKKNHYSGKVVQNSRLHFGVYLDGGLHGVMQYGPSLDKSKLIGLVENTGWNEFIELNRMAFDDYLPKNSESRAIAMSLKLIKRNAPHIKWVVSYADGCECGDGTIYRASGFILTSVKPNKDIYVLPNGKKIHSMSIKSSKKIIEKHGKWKRFLEKEHAGYELLEGNQLRYIYLIDKSSKLTCETLPYSMISQLNAKMYKGVRQ